MQSRSGHRNRTFYGEDNREKIQKRRDCLHEKGVAKYAEKDGIKAVNPGSLLPSIDYGRISRIECSNHAHYALHDLYAPCRDFPGVLLHANVF